MSGIVERVDGRAVSTIGAAFSAQALASGQVAAGQVVRLRLHRGDEIAVTAAAW